MSEPIGVYVHWPFCEAKCPYCDFNSHLAAAVDHDRWRRALVRDVGAWADRMPGRTVGSVFFGGGTPSLMAPGTVAAVIEAIDAAWGLAADAEVTLEANPTSVEAGKLRGFAAAGVNRVSLGVQALRDDALRALGRRHSAAEALAALDVARACFDRVSADLIYAREDQSPEAWEAELREMLARGPDHLSLYQLTIEPGTPFHRRVAAGGMRGLPDEDRGADLFAATQAICAEAGLPAYEVSNHARPGAEARHNLVYWRAGDWAGVGPGAHGRFGTGPARRLSVGVAAPEAWLDGVEAGGGAHRVEDMVLEPDEHGVEALMMGLRLTEGVETARLEALGLAVDAAERRALVRDGLLHDDATRLRATAAGRMLLNAVIARLMP